MPRAHAITLAPTLTGDYTLDSARSRIGFVARHAMITKVRGVFEKVDGTGHLDAANPANSSLQATIEVASIDTRSSDRDHQLRTNDFFDVPKYPEITFASTSVVPVDKAHFTVTGDLTVKAVTKPVTIDFALTGPTHDPDDTISIALAGNIVVNRKDWGVSWNAALEAGGVLVGEKVTLTFEVVATKDD